ncbi:acyltransferase [Cellvibrio zantedeschiae]|uniref:Acyltransferase n=1 Tax=Cellvibrio zantedeschiae TaxID=1237077 RepID=A0ABQ3ATM4_9GAMM|nr:GNAT family N-acetyltransferase [Cellvibrio zantedeschiae]GGY65570.1 acyltransferase [Cellvibrio zantedeschiae]
MLDLRVDLEKCTFELISELRLPLVNRFYSSCNYRVKCGRFERVYSLALEGNIIAAARLIPQRSGHFLLRNLCVEPALRNQGVASYLLRTLLVSLGEANCYCYALPHLQHFYLSLQFTHLAPEQVPQDIAEMYIRHRERKRGWFLMGYINSAGLAQLEP